MRYGKRLALGLAVTLALLVVVITVAAVAIPRLVDLPRLRAQVVDELSQQVHGPVTIDALRLALLPLPHVLVDDVSVSEPGVADVYIGSVSLYPDLWSLLRGHLRPARITIVEPVVRMAQRSADGSAAASPEQAKDGLAALLAGGTAALPDLTLHVLVQRGQVHLAPAAGSEVAVSAIEGRVTLDKKQVVVEATGTSSLAKHISAHAAIDPAHAAVDARIADIDVPAVRTATGGLAQTVPAVATVFAILRSGRVTQLTLHSEGATPADLARPSAIEVRGTVVDAQIHIPGVDLDLEDVGGDVVIESGSLSGEHLVARYGRSRGRNGSLRLDLAPTPLALNVGLAIDADAVDLIPLLKRLGGDGLRTALERVRDVQGTAKGKLTVSGTTADVVVAAAATELQLSADVPGMNDRLRIDGGSVSYAAQAVVARDLSVHAGGSELSQLSISGDWAAVPASLAVTLNRGKIVLAEIYPWLAASGSLGDSASIPQAIAGTMDVNSFSLDGPAATPGRWRFEAKGGLQNLAVDSAPLRQWTHLRSGVSLAGMHVARDARGRLTAGGTFRAPDDLSGAIDVLWVGDELRIPSFSLRNQKSDAKLTMVLKGRDLDVTFDGNLDRATLDSLVVGSPFSGAWLHGKLRARVPLGEPARLTADGHLEAGDVVLPTKGASLRAETVVIDGHESSFSIRAALVTDAQKRFEVDGTVVQSPPDVVVDLNIAGGAVDWATIQSFLPGSTEPAGAATRKSPGTVRGSIRVAADSFTYEQLTWKPLKATVTLAAGAASVTIDEADLCGIATPGTIATVPVGLDISFQPQAKTALATTLECLSAEKGLITGDYTLKSKISARAAAAALNKSLHGKLAFEATKGRIYRTQVAKTLLSVFSIATGSVLNMTDMAKQGLEYDRIVLEGELRGRTLQFTKVLLDAPAAQMVGEGSIDLVDQTINLTLLVAPLKNVDMVVSHIPILGNALGGTIVSIPVRISGPINDSTVTPMSPSAVGERLRGIMESTIKMPVKLFHKLQPGRE